MYASMQPADAASSSKHAPSPQSRSILKNGFDRAFLDETPDQQPLRHSNIRGQGYFH
jgi:transposase